MILQAQIVGDFTEKIKNGNDVHLNIKEQTGYIGGTCGIYPEFGRFI